MAKLLISSWWFRTFLLVLVLGIKVYAVPYDYSFTNECLEKPLKPLYGGGIVVQSELNVKLDSGMISAEANIGVGAFDGGIFDPKIKQCLSQKFYLEKAKLYAFSAWFKVSKGNADVGAVFITSTTNYSAASVVAQEGCWSMVKGGFVANETETAELFFESTSPEVSIYAASISLQPFTEEEWRSHQDQSVEKFRKSRVKFQAVDQHGRPISNATVSIKQLRPSFPFGSAINLHLIGNPTYQNWFLSRFKYTVFENELKWYANEEFRGVENYTHSDALVKFAQSNGISIRGHNVFWANAKHQPKWVPGLSSDELRVAADKRIKSAVNRYKGQLIHWDVANENLHFDFFESKLGANASIVFYEMANQIDGKAIPFLNEYNTIEHVGDMHDKATPSKYLRRICDMRKQGYNGPLGIGLQAHYTRANPPYTRSVLDQMASAKLPIWITELDVKAGPKQVTYLEQVIRDIHSHSAVEGLMLWTAWSPGGKCDIMCLTDGNFKNLATGDVVDKFISEWTHAADAPGITNGNGLFGTSLFHGDYEATVSLSNGEKHSCSQNFSVVPNEGATIVFKIDI